MARPEALFLLPSLMRGGAETQLVQLVNHLPGKQLGKRLVTFEAPQDQLPKLDQESVRYERILRRGKFDRGLARSIGRIMDEPTVAVAHCTLIIAMFYGWLARRQSRRRPPLIAAVHKSYNQSRRVDLIDRAMTAWVLKDFDRIVFVCENQRRIWTERHPSLADRATVIYNGVDADHFDPDGLQHDSLRSSLDISPAERVIACVARFSPVKGHAHLIESFAKVPGEPVLLLAGDGELRADIEADVARRGLSGRVHFLGSVSDVRPVLQASDVLVLPSVSETFSMAMLEAFSMRVPVVGSDVGGMSEAVIPGRTGDLAPVGDSDRLAAALARTLADTDALRAMGMECRRMALERFSLSTMVEHTEALLVDTAARHAQATSQGRA